MNLQKAIFPLFILISFLFVSCSDDDNNEDDAQVLVTVVSDTGKLLPGEIVKMFDEKTYAEFEEDNQTNPTASAETNSNGVATFIITYAEWFKSNKDRFLTFAVQHGSAGNYTIWSSGSTIRPGSKIKIELKLKALSNK